MNLVSIIVPVYNAEATIQASLISVVNQSYKDFEIIIINDGSTDESEKIIKDFIAVYKDVNIQYYYQVNKGVSAARNLGLKHASGDYIALLDSDDVWDKNKTKIQLDIFKKYGHIDLLATNRNGEKFRNFLGKRFQKITKISARLMLYKNFLLTPTVIFKRKIIDEVGYFNETMSHAEDFEYFLRITARFQCYLYNESMVITGFGKPTFGHSGLSKSMWKMEKGELGNIKLAYKLKLVGVLEYIFLLSFSILKFLRRLIISALR